MGYMPAERFESLRARHIAIQDRRNKYRLDVLLRKYAKRNPPRSWMTRTEIGKLEAFDRAESKISDAMFTLLDVISPRDWRSTVPHHWVMSELTYADATTREAMSVVPPSAYESSRQDSERFARKLS